MDKLVEATSKSHASDDSPSYDAADLTGIPTHVVDYVHHEKASKKIDLKFNEYFTLLIKELDKREMGGNMTMELIQESIQNPLKAELASMRQEMQNQEDPNAY